MLTSSSSQMVQIEFAVPRASIADSAIALAWPREIIEVFYSGNSRMRRTTDGSSGPLTPRTPLTAGNPRTQHGRKPT